MGWKKALFLGGAVLLLAACSDATAPAPAVTRSGVPSAAAKAKGNVAPTTAPTVDPLLAPLTDCRSGYYVRVGDKDVCILDTALQ